MLDPEARCDVDNGTGLLAVDGALGPSICADCVESIAPSKTPFVVQLQHVKPGSKILLSNTSDGSTSATLDFLDGSYSHCTTDRGGVLYIHRFAPLEVTGNGYLLIETVR